MKKKEVEKENLIQKRKLTSATDPELKLAESRRNLAPENSPNRKVRWSFFKFLTFISKLYKISDKTFH